MITVKRYSKENDVTFTLPPFHIRSQHHDRYAYGIHSEDVDLFLKELWAFYYHSGDYNEVDTMTLWIVGNLPMTVISMTRFRYKKDFDAWLLKQLEKHPVSREHNMICVAIRARD